MRVNDPWKFLAFPICALVAYFAADILVEEVASMLSTTEMNARLGVLAGVGFAVGFLVDEMIPVYIQKVREGSSGSAGGAEDFGGGGDLDSGGEDFSFE